MWALCAQTESVEEDSSDEQRDLEDEEDDLIGEPGCGYHTIPPSHVKPSATRRPLTLHRV